ncbi:hypothetical protein M422DRAFT_64358 [Sphaerobolus stellatus SS14]|nr:hypothetical protein M422DRAFT_64358 [Sphaerobolus stellatus SS14]
MSATFLNEPQPAPPRRFRIGGYRISNDVAAQWAEKLTGRDLDPARDSYTIKKTIFKITKPFDVNFRQVGEVADVHWMLITQAEKFEGYKDMDPAKIPKFELGERDVHAKKLLEDADLLSYALGIEEYKFATVLD